MNWLKQHNRIVFATIGVWLVFSIAHVAWVMIDQSPPLWDMAGHSVRTAVAADYLSHGHFLSIMTEDSVYPPAAYLVAAPFLALTWAADVPQLSLLFWIALLEVSMVFLGVRLFRSPWVGLGAFAMAMTYPLPLHFTRIFDLDFPQAAAVTAAVAAAVMSKRFTDRRWSIVCGVLVGLAMLTKFTAGIFLIGPLVVIASISLLDGASRLRALTNIGYTAFATLLLSVPWYALHGDEVLDSSEAAAFNTWSIPFTDLFSFENAAHYLELLTAGMGWPFLLAAALGAGVLWHERAGAPAKRYGLVLFVWIFVPYLVLTYAFSAKEARYVLPLYYPLALITVAGLAQLSKIQRIAGAVLLSVIGLWFFVSTGFGWQPLSNAGERQLAIDHTYGYQTLSPKQPGYGYTWPTQYHANLPEVSAMIVKDMQERGIEREVRVAVIPNSIFLTAQQIQWYALLEAQTTNMALHIEYSLSSQIRFGYWQLALPSADYIVAKNGDQGPAVWGANLKDIRDIEMAAASGDPNDLFLEYELVNEWTLQGIELEDRPVRVWRRKQ